MNETTDIRYASSGGVHLAYRVQGQGPPLLSMGNFATNLEALESVDLTRRFITLLSGVFQYVHYDQRGTGLSDRASTDLNSLDTWLNDALAVLDDAGIDQALILGPDFSGPLAIAFAARYPHRTSGLVLWATYPALAQSEEYPIGVSGELRAGVIDSIVTGWGDANSRFAMRAAPGAEREQERVVAARIQRQSIGRGELRSTVEAMFELDVRHLLADIEAPTLILHRRGDRLVPIEFSRYLAGHIPNAELVELTGDDHYIMVGDVELAVAEIARFHGAGPLPSAGVRGLAVLVFVDIAESTSRAAAVGDGHWRNLLDEHDARVRDYLELYGGRAVNWIGDGVLATFDSPGRAMRCGLAISRAGAARDLPVRVGIHAGEVEHRGDDVAGLAVHIAQRVEASAASGEVMVSRTIRDLVAGSDFEFIDRGLYHLKGVPEEWQLFGVSSA